MNCEEIRDLLPAYVLGTATPHEIGVVEDHLARCGLHEEVAALTASAVLVASGAKSVEPPAALKARIMAHTAGATAGVRREHGTPRRPWLRRLLAVNPVAAVGARARVAMAGGNVALQGAESPEKVGLVYRGQDSDWLRVETVLGDPGAEVSLGGFDRLDDSQLYHLWTTRGDQVLLIGAFNVNPEGKWAGEFDFVFEEGDRIWMTSESASGTDQPTGDPVLRTSF